MKRESVDMESFVPVRVRHGAELVGVRELFERSEIVSSIAGDDTPSVLCVELQEFMASATRNAAGALRVLERLRDADDPDLVAALKKYVEDTGQALKEVDGRLKRRKSSLAELFPEIAGDAETAATWRDLIGRRDVIAHQILSVDDTRVRAEAARDFETLHGLLSNVFFVPATIDLSRGRGPSIALRSSVLHGLPASEPGQGIRSGSAVVVVCEDVQDGIVAFRLGRSPDNKLLVASSRTGTIRVRVAAFREPGSPPSQCS